MLLLNFFTQAYSNCLRYYRFTKNLDSQRRKSSWFYSQSLILRDQL